MVHLNILHLPRGEKITKDATVVHFLLMFGYKLFSLFFPLFLISKEMSFTQVGWTYLFIYLPIALFSPVVGFLNHKINPAVLSFFGILGYGIYGLGILFVSPEESIHMLYLFYGLQILLGVAAALFFTSFKGILMGSRLKKPSTSFAWFYSAPFYATAVAPVIGAILIWQFGFSAVFAVSTVVHIVNSILCLLWLYIPAKELVDVGFGLRDFLQSIKKSVKIISEKSIFPAIMLSLTVITLSGFYGSFFVIFLKESLLWEGNSILIFVSVLSLIFTPASLFIIKRISHLRPEKNLLEGSIMTGFFTILIGVFAPFLNFINLLLLDLGRTAGSLSVNSVRSGLICDKLKDHPEEGGFIDTIFQPLGIAVGSFIGSLLIGLIGFSNVFVLLGSLSCIASLLFYINQR